MAALYEDCIQCPLAVLESQPYGCALDIGSSLVKLAYCTPYDHKKEETQEMISIELRIYTEEAIEKALDIAKHVKKHARSNEKVHVTGTGVYRHIESLNNAFGNGSIQMVIEYECNARALKFICHHLPIYSAFNNFGKDSIKESGSLVQEIFEGLNAINTSTKGTYLSSCEWFEEFELFDANFPTEDNKEPMDLVQNSSVNNSFVQRYPDMYPCFITMLGSACHWTVVNSNGTYEPVDFTSRGGITLMGLASLLTGAKNFEELLHLAETGDHKAVDIINRDFMSDNPEDPYSKYAKSLLCFSFGKARQKNMGDFRKEDLARSILITIINDIVQSTMSYAALYNIKTIFLGGNMINHWLVRHEFTKAVCTRKCCNSKLNASIYYLRQGGCLGALGSLLSYSHEKTSSSS